MRNATYLHYVCKPLVAGRAHAAADLGRAVRYLGFKVASHPTEVTMARVINRTRNVILADRADIAKNVWTRGKGLLGRRGLPEGEGLVIEPCSSIHTLFMAFPIDVA